MKKKDLTNLFSLVGVQGANALFPLLIFPYLFLRLESDKFSVLVASEAVILFVLAVCLFSYDVSGVSRIVNARTTSDRCEESIYYWSIMVTRLALLTVMLLLVMAATVIFYSSYFLSILLWFMFPLGMILQSNYYFQACEENISICVFVFCSRVLACILIYVFIKEPDDYLLSISVLAGSYFFSGVLSVLYVLLQRRLKFTLLPVKSIWFSIKSEVSILIGNLSVALFRGSNILVLSLVSSPDAVAVYALAEKTVKSFQALARPLNQLAFPKLVRDLKGKTAWSAIRTSIWHRTWAQLGALAAVIPVVIAVLYVLSSMELWRGYEGEALLLTALMSGAIFFGIPNYMFGTIGLNLLGFSDIYAASIAIAGVTTLAVSLLLCSAFGEYGGVGSFVFGECLLFAIIYVKYLGWSGVNNK